jgi:hypothetical protein
MSSKSGGLATQDFFFARLLDPDEERLRVPFVDARLAVDFEPLARVEPRFEPRLV